MNCLVSFLIESFDKQNINVYFDNIVFIPKKYEIKRESQNSKKKIELILNDCEIRYFSKHIANFGLIKYLEKFKNLKGKRKKKQLNKISYLFKGGFKMKNQLKRFKIINFIEIPYQIFIVNNEKYQIVEFQNLLYVSKSPEYKIIGEFCNS